MRLLVPAAALLLAALPAVPASAAGGITSPGPDEVVVEERVVALRAVVEAPAVGPTRLSLQGPLEPAPTVVAVQTSPDGGELAYDFDTRCGAQACTDRRPARNGTWVVRLEGGAQDERRFELRIPPAAPVDLTAELAGDTVQLSWRRGAEPDLTSYAVEDTTGTVVLRPVAVETCDERCTAQVPAEPGRWAVRAYRAACPECLEELESPLSEPVGLDADEAAQVAEQPAEQTAGQEPVRRQDQLEAFREAFGTPPPMAPAAAPRHAAPVAPQPEGTYDPTLGYDVPEQGSVPARVAGITGQSVGGMLVAGALVAAGLWLRRWGRRAIADPP